MVRKDFKKKIEQYSYRSPLGFYKEREKDEAILEIKDDGASYFVEIPTHLRNRAEIVVGSRIKGNLLGIYKKGGEKKVELRRTFNWEVEGYWNELHIPKEEVSTLGLKVGDYLHLEFKSVINYGEEIPL